MDTLDEKRIIDWGEDLVLDIPILDDQHRSLVRIINKLHVVGLKGSDTITRSFIEGTKEAIHYLRFHFATEEKLMIILDFPGVEEHTIANAAFMEEVINRSKELSEDNQYTPEALVSFLKDRFLSHISSYDNAFANYIFAMEHHKKFQFILTRGKQLSPLSA